MKVIYGTPVGVDSDQSLYVPYGGKELKSNQRCFWKVKVYTANGETEWSEPASWGMGLLGESHWSGRWIGWDAPFAWDKEVTHSRLSARYLRTEFKAKGGIKRATVHISGLGLYELFINGKQVGRSGDGSCTDRLSAHCALQFV